MSLQSRQKPGLKKRFEKANWAGIVGREPGRQRGQVERKDGLGVPDVKRGFGRLVADGLYAGLVCELPQFRKRARRGEPARPGPWVQRGLAGDAQQVTRRAGRIGNGQTAQRRERTQAALQTFRFADDLLD